MTKSHCPQDLFLIHPTRQGQSRRLPRIARIEEETDVLVPNSTHTGRLARAVFFSPLPREENHTERDGLSAPVG